MGKYHRWFSIAAAVVFIAGIADTAIFVHTKLDELFERLIPLSVPNTMELSFKEAGIYTVLLDTAVDGRGRTLDDTTLTMKSKATGAEILGTFPSDPFPLHIGAGWYLWEKRIGISLTEFHIPHAGVYELDAQIAPESPVPLVGTKLLTIGKSNGLKSIASLRLVYRAGFRPPCSSPSSPMRIGHFPRVFSRSDAGRNRQARI